MKRNNEILDYSAASIGQIMEIGTEMSQLFIDYRTDCVGCSLAAFCTLDDAIELYGLGNTNFRSKVEALLETPDVNSSMN